VLALALTAVGTMMDGRAAFSDPRPPASCSLSLRFSLRACDFEYGARDASKPETPNQSFPRNGCMWCANVAISRWGGRGIR
jgi:hypothetical protein